jgi:hypothetical protein
VIKLDRSKLMIEVHFEDSDESDRAYWLDRTPIERLQAMQFFRQVAYGETSATIRLQRVLEVAERE